MIPRQKLTSFISGAIFVSLMTQQSDVSLMKNHAKVHTHDFFGDECESQKCASSKAGNKFVGME